MTDLKWPDDPKEREELMAEAARTGRKVRLRNGSVGTVVLHGREVVYYYLVPDAERLGGVISNVGLVYGDHTSPHDFDITGWAEPEAGEQPTPDPDAAARALRNEMVLTGYTRGLFDDLKPEYQQQTRQWAAAVRAVVEGEYRQRIAELERQLATTKAQQAIDVESKLESMRDKPASDEWWHIVAHGTKHAIGYGYIVAAYPPGTRVNDVYISEPFDTVLARIAAAERSNP